MPNKIIPSTNNQIITKKGGPSEKLRQSITDYVKNLTDKEKTESGKLKKLDPLNAIKKTTNIVVYKEFICSLLKEEKEIDSNKIGKLYNINVDGIIYNVEIISGPINTTGNQNFKSIFGKKIEKIISASTYHDKIFVIYL